MERFNLTEFTIEYFYIFVLIQSSDDILTREKGMFQRKEADIKFFVIGMNRAWEVRITLVFD